MPTNFPFTPNLGRNWSLLQVAPVTESESAGTYTEGTYVSILATIIEHGEEGLREVENISPATQSQRNPVQIEVGSRVTISEYMTNAIAGSATTKQSKLRELDYANSLIGYKHQGLSTGTTETFILRITGSNSRRVKGGNIYSITGETIAVVSGGNPSSA